MAGLIVVRLFGGLGNQMFQYALGRRLAIDRGATLKLDTRPLNADALRDYALGGFRIEAAVATAAELSGLLPWPARLPRKLSWLPRWPGRIPLLVERHYHFAPEVLNAPPSACIEGYWQSERYFSSIVGQLRSDFQLQQPFSAGRQADAAKICDTRETTAVSVHVRRGDYVSNPTTQAAHGTCSPQWYEQTMAQMAESVGSPVFYIFSDDPAWAKENLPARWPRHFVEPQGDGRDHEDMHLMALCRHHIIANSSFSWWGAWLDPGAQKRVIVPARWFNNAANDTVDLIPPGWQRI